MTSNEQSSHIYALRPGTMLHEFSIEAVLGHGGFGITYKALDTALDKAVAIKEYLPNDLASRESDSTIRARSRGDQQQFESGVAAFLDEARLVARLRHRNIMEVLRFFKANGTGYIVLGYEHGRTLKQRLEEGPLNEAELRKVLGGLLDGIEVLHNEAILHRDIKPSNIILSDSRVPGERGVPVLIDFGAARDFRSRHSRSVTTIVAPGYAPPEQYGVGGQAGPWSDLYALGATAYRCVTGEAPPEALRRLRKDPYVPALEVASGRYDASLLHLIDRMLAVEEADRPQSVAEVREALRSRALPPAGPRRAGAAPHASAPSRSLRVAGFVGAVAVAAIAALGATWWSGGTMPQWFGQLQTRIAAGTSPATPVAPATPAVPSTNTAASAVAPKPPEPPKAEPRPVDEVKPAEASPSDAAPKADQVANPDTAVKSTETTDAPAKPAEAPKTQPPIQVATSAPVAAPLPPRKRTVADAIADGYQPISSATSCCGEALAFSPNGHTLASRANQLIMLWDVATGRARPLFEAKQESPSTFAFSPDGRTLVSGHARFENSEIKLWDVESGRVLRSMTSPEIKTIFSVAFSPDGRTVASGFRSNDQTVMRSFLGGKPYPVASHDPHTLKLWDVASGRPVRTFLTPDDGVINSVAFSPDGRNLAANCAYCALINIWDVASGRGRTLKPVSSGPPGFTIGCRSVRFSPDGRMLAAACSENKLYTIKMWDFASGRELRSLTGHGGYINSIAFSPDGRNLASASSDQTVKVWDAASGRLLHSFTNDDRGTEDKDKEMKSVVYSPDGRRLASSSANGKIFLWSVADHVLQARYQASSGLTNGPDPIYGAISFDGKGLPITLSGNQGWVYGFVKDRKEVRVSEMLQMGYDVPATSEDRKYYWKE